MSDPKEPWFFELEKEYQRGLDFYKQKYFSHYDDETWIGQSRHRNLYLPWIPQRIEEHFPEAKFIVSLRNPVERAFSHYWHNVRYYLEDESFEDAIYQDYIRIQKGKRYRTKQEKKHYENEFSLKGLYRSYIDIGYYHEQIQRYIERFGRETIKIVFFEDLVEDPETVTNEILKFLELSPLDDLSTPRMNEGSVPKSTRLHRLVTWTRNLSVSSLIPQKIKDFIREKLFQSKTTAETEMNRLTELWLYQHFETHNKKLNQILRQELPEDWHHDFQ